MKTTMVATPLPLSRSRSRLPVPNTIMFQTVRRAMLMSADMMPTKTMLMMRSRVSSDVMTFLNLLAV